MVHTCQLSCIVTKYKHRGVVGCISFKGLAIEIASGQQGRNCLERSVREHLGIQIILHTSIGIRVIEVHLLLKYHCVNIALEDNTEL